MFNCVTCPRAQSGRLCECVAAVPEGDREIDAGPADDDIDLFACPPYVNDFTNEFPDFNILGDDYYRRF